MAEWTITDLSGKTGAARIVGDGVDGMNCLEFYDSDGLLNGSDTDLVAYRDYELPSSLTQATNYTLSSWVKTIGISGTTKAKMTIRCYNSSGTQIGGDADYIVEATDKQWTKGIFNNFQAPVNTKKIRIMLRSNAKDNEVMRFDAVQLEQKRLAAPYTGSTRFTSRLKYSIFPSISNGSGTMGVWFNTRGFESNRYIFENMNSNYAKLSLYGDVSGNLCVGVTNSLNVPVTIINTGDSKYANNFNLNNAPNQWHMAALTWSTSGSTLSCTLYIYNNRGVAYTYSESITGVKSFAGASTTIGSDISGSNHLNGAMGTFFYSSAKLTNNDMQNIYSRGKGVAKNNNYDVLGRITNTSIKNTLFSYERDYSYFNGINGSSTSLVNSVESKIVTSGGITSTVTTSYDYDDNGNISKITEDGKEIEYFYNELNELKRENNQVLDKTIIYSYDAGGNITSKTEYAYTKNENPGTPTRTINYTYDSEWKDLLLTYDGGSEIIYDPIGNPLNDGVREYIWEEGRNLSRVIKGADTINFKYNDSGIRYEKTVNGVTTRYHLVGDRVTYETNGTDSIYYTYDASGSLLSINLNGSEYYYVRNSQGDITGI